jgi:hypothetical protein
VRRDLEKGGVIGFEPVEVEGKVLPIQWKGTTARPLKGTMVRTHEIGNAGKPITTKAGNATHQLLHSTIDGAICVVKYSEEAR